MIPWWVALGAVFVVFVAGLGLGAMLGATALQAAHSVIDDLRVALAVQRNPIKTEGEERG